MGAQNQVNARHGLRQFHVLLVVAVADLNHRVDLLLFPQAAHNVLRHSRTVDELRIRRQVRRPNQAGVARPGDGEHAELDAAALDNQVGLAVDLEVGFVGRGLDEVGAEHGIGRLGAALLEQARAVVELVVAQGHRFDQPVEPVPLRAQVFVRPRRLADVHGVPAVEGNRVRVGQHLTPQVADGAGDAGLVCLALAIEGHGVAVVVGEVEDGDGRRTALRLGQAAGQEQGEQEQGARETDAFHRGNLLWVGVTRPNYSRGCEAKASVASGLG